MNRLRWIVVVLALAACAALVWFGGPAVAIGGRAILESDVRRLAVIALLLALATLTLVWRAAAARTADRRLAEGLVQEAPRRRGRPEDDAMRRSLDESDLLRARFREALGVLGRSSGAGGRRLRELPLYVLVGPPGAGKTAALRHAGLRFPLAGRFGDEALRGVGGTRHCDWWFTNDAVLLDTAGRYTTHESDEEVDASSWDEFLALLRRWRKRRPINGIIVAISLADILDADAARRARHAEAIRQRIQEFGASLRRRFPVYLVLTKADLVAGFAEFFDSLEPVQREQVWGVTFAPDEADAPAAFKPAFDALVARLNDRMLTRLEEERDAERRARSFGFPRGVAALRSEIGAFVDAAFGATPYDATPWLRGVYLTSATQEGAPIDPSQAAITQAFGLPESVRHAARAAGRSYFLGGLLRQVIFPEADLVDNDRGAGRRRSWQRGVALALLASGLLGVLALWVAGHARDGAAIERLRVRVSAYAAAQAGPGAETASPDDLLHRLDALRALSEDAAASPSRLERAFGLQQAQRLEQAAQRAYVRELERLLAPRLAAGLAEALRGADSDGDAAYATLKGLVMLAQPERRDAAWLRALARIVWTRAWPDAPAKVDRMQVHLDALLAGSRAPVAVDEDAVRDARATLGRLPLADLAYGRIRRAALEAGEAPWRLRDALGGAGAAAFEHRGGTGQEAAVPAFYTPEGYTNTFLPQSLRLTQTLRDETWVLGTRRDDLGPGELATLADDVGRRYAADYVKAWQTLLAETAPASLREPTHALSVLAQLTGPNSALRALLLAVRRNTMLVPPVGEAAANRIGQRVEQAQSDLQGLLRKAGASARAVPPPTPAAIVTQAFAELDAVAQPTKDGPAPIDAVIERLGKLYAEVDATSARADPDPARGDSPAARGLRELALAQPEPLKAWLMQLADGAVQLGEQHQQAAQRKKLGDDAKALREKINATWQSDVLPFCTAAIANRYPADRRSAVDATPKDFGRLFAPGGLIDAFVKDNLKPYVDMSRHPWRWRSADDIDLGARPESLHALEIAAMWRDAFFRDGSPVPAMEFGVKPIAPDAAGLHAALSLGEQQRIDRAAPARFATWRWPAPDGVQQAGVSLGDARGDSRGADGPWAWMRLLDQATIDHVTPDRVLATFHLASGDAQVELRATSVINPLQPQAAERFDCPKGF